MAFSGKLELFLINPPSLCTQDYIGITNWLFYELSLMCLTSKVPFVMLTSQLTNGSSFHLLLLFSPHKPDTKVSRGEKKKPLIEKWISLCQTVSKEEPLSMLYQRGPSGRVKFPIWREASSAETKSSLERFGDTTVCPSQRARFLAPKRSG